MDESGRWMEEMELEEDMRFQRREWVAERVGWASMAGVLVTSLFGVFGGSGIANQLDVDGGGVSVEGDRFVRLGAPTTLEMIVHEPVRADGGARVWLSDGYLERVEVQTILPRPERTVREDGGVAFEFGRAEVGARIWMTCLPMKAGTARGLVGTGAEEAVGLSQFVYP